MGALLPSPGTLRRLSWLALLLLAPPLAALEVAGGVRLLRAADEQPADYPTVQAVQFMGQSLYRQSGGRLAIQVYSASLLGDEAALVPPTQRGELDLNRVSVQTLEDLCPALRVLSLPFLFRDVEHLDRVLDVPEEGIRREGAILEREKFEIIAARLRASYSWR